MRRFLIIVLITLTGISLFAATNRTNIINQQNQTITELKNQNAKIIENNTFLINSIDSIKQINQLYSNMNDELTNNLEFARKNIELQNNKIQSLQAEEKKLSYFLYAFVFLSLTLVSVVTYNIVKIKKLSRTIGKTNEKHSEAFIPMHDSVVFQPDKGRLKELFPVVDDQAKLNISIEKTIKKAISENIEPIYNLIQKSRDEIENNSTNLEKLNELLEKEGYNSLKKEPESLSLLEKEELHVNPFTDEKKRMKATNSNSSFGNSKLHKAKNINNEDFLDEVLKNQSKVHSSVGTFPNINGKYNSGSFSKNDRVGSNPYTQNKNKFSNSINTLKNSYEPSLNSRAVIPNSIHSCLTEYNTILRQINVGMMTDQEIDKRIEFFKKTFNIRNLEYSGDINSSVDEFSENRFGNYFLIDFENKKYLLPSFNETMDNLIHAFGYNGMSAKINPPAVLPRQVIRFATIANSRPGTWHLREKGQLL